MTPLVSILIPAYNSGPWLRQTLESVLAQTHPRTEIIVVNDGSTDDTGAILETYASRGVRVIHQTNQGQTASLNRALAGAAGDFIQYLDADDLLSPDKIERQLEHLSRHPPGAIASCSWARFTRDPSEAVFQPEPVWRDCTPVEWLALSWSGGGMMHGAAWLLPRAVVEAAGPWNPSLTLINDFEYFARALLASDAVAFCPGARTYYRSNIPGSLSNLRSDRAWRSAFTAMRLGTSYLLAREDSPRTRAAASITYQRLVQDAYPAVPDLIREAEARIREIGGPKTRAEGGKPFQIASRLLGWKAARRLQLALAPLRRQR